MAESEDNRERRRAYGRAYTRKKRQADPDKARAELREYRANNPLKVAYWRHKSQAKWRGIPFLLTFEEWWAIWQASGRWEQRGPRKGYYVMGRHGDRGAYAIGNVRICLSDENKAEQYANLSNEARLRVDYVLREGRVLRHRILRALM
jgi:hypothetical protein